MAENVRDFVDEWIASPWVEAKDWSAPDPALPRLHAQLHAGRSELVGEFASIRACGNGVTQVELSRGKRPVWYVFATGGEAGPWTVQRIEPRAEAACSGPDILKPKPD